MEHQEHTAKVAQPPSDMRSLVAGDFEVAPAQREPRRRGEHLHVCPPCGSTLVHPTDWAPAPGRRWHVELRCPECEWTGAGTYGQSVVDRFDAALDEGTEAILEGLTVLAKANMEEHVESFIAAIWAEQVLPEDF